MRTRWSLAIASATLLAWGCGGSSPTTQHPTTTAPSTSTSVSASTTASAPPPHAAINLKIERFTLPNGLRVVLNPEPTSPTVSVVVWYDVGSRNEGPGEGGFAHLFEHVMFEGSANVPRGVHDKIIEGRGGSLNAQTSEDWTRYHELMPSSELAATLYLEADRMRSLAVTQDAFENQRKVVEEEYRMRVDESAYTKGYFRLNEMLYDNYRRYAHPAIGSMKELDDAKLDWVVRFHKAYYMPNNAVLVIAGDFDVSAAKEMVSKYFGDIDRGTVPASSDVVPEGTIGPARAEVVQDPLARATLSYIGFRVPRDGTSEHRALELAASILAEGDSSRLVARYVREMAVAQSVEAYLEGHRGPDAFVIEVHHASQAPQTPETTEEQVWASLQAFADSGPTDAEMDTARAKIEHEFVFGLQGNLQRALTLANYEGAFGDANLATTDMDRYFAISKDEVKAVVAKYLVRAASRVVRVVPAPEPPPAPSASASSSSKGAHK